MNFSSQVDKMPIVLEEVFELHKSESAIYSDDEITISLVKVMDSRCPENTNCIWAGELSVQLEITNKNKVATHTLTVPAVGTRNQKSEININDLHLSFLGQAKSKMNKATAAENTVNGYEFILSTSSSLESDK